MIDSMATDLGVSPFEGEALVSFQSRVIYSAMACWVKSAALDRSVGCENGIEMGASKRHVYERCNAVLSELLKMYPDTKNWFEIEKKKDNPINLIRSRLINHGDILIQGFDTNIVLSSNYTKQISSDIETVYGVVLDESIYYSGIAALRTNEIQFYSDEKADIRSWYNSFIKEIGWTKNSPDYSRLQFFNPGSSAKNNYSAWQDSIENTINGVSLARMSLNNNMYSYYLLRPSDKLSHSIDPFLKEQLYHIRIMYAQRALANRRLSAEATHYGDYVRLHLNARLPLEEKIVLESYAWPVNNIDDGFDWIMIKQVWDYIMPILKSLGIHIEEVENG